MNRLILTDAALAAFDTGEQSENDERMALAIEGDNIAYIGIKKDLPDAFSDAPSHSLDGCLVTPGLIDCHTHLVYGGSRAKEFAMRQNGASYAEVMEAGGGIFSTVNATRSATNEQLLESALARIDRLIAEGVTTVEIKSGYGLDHDTELRMLRIARELEQHRKIRVVTTFLGAHAYPADMTADDYLTNICLPTLEAAAKEGLVDAVDGFCETVGFNTQQIDRVFEAAQALNLPVKLHAEQLSDQSGAALAARYDGLSADHLEYLSDEGVAAMAKSNMVAVILPGAFYTLRETQKPPIEKLRNAGVPMAIGTDSNPGSSPMTSILLAMNMAATLFGLTAKECLDGVTLHAAQALGLSDCGVIRTGARADLAVWDVADPAELSYRIGDAPLKMRIFGGQIC